MAGHNRGTCDNRLTIRRDVLEETVLTGLRDNLLHPDLVAEFIAEFQREYNRLRRAEEAAETSKRKELAKVERQIARIIEAVKEGLYVPAMKGELLALEERKAALVEEMEDPREEPPHLHPGLAQVYRRKVAELTAALNEDDLRTEAAETIRSLIEEIKLIPRDGQLMIELVGALAGILALGEQERPRPGGQGRQLRLVAGAGFGQTPTNQALTASC